MNVDNTETQEALSRRIETLRLQIVEAARQNDRKRKTYLVAGMLLITLSVFGFCSLTGQTMKLDAEVVTELGRLEIEKQLPGEVANLKEYLTDNAPTLIANLIRASLGTLPNLRESLVSDVTTKMTAVTEAYEQLLTDAMSDAIRASKQNIDAANLEGNDLDKMDQLVKEVAGEFQKGTKAAIHEVYPVYSSEMNRVKAYLTDLHTKDDSELTEQQRTQKELIQTLLRLMASEGVQLPGTPRTE